MKVFVTGASGFIGSHLIRTLINAGHKVLALAIPDDNLWRMQDILSHNEILRGTMQDVSTIQNQLRIWQPQTCIHLAWYAEPGKYLSSRENLVSLQNSLNLLQILSECNCEQFIGAGTCAEYEIKAERFVENDRTKPATLYAASKLSFQMMGEQIAQQVGLRFAWGRIFYLYGPQEDARRLVPSAILKLQKGESFSATPGEQKRDYLHVADVANAFLTLAEHQANGIYNICSAEAITIKSLLNTVGNLMEKPELLIHGALPYREWEPMYICGDNRKLRELGWQPQIGLKEGLEDTITWWHNQ